LQLARRIGANQLSPCYNVSRYSTYQHDKLSRLALLSELSECHSYYKIRSSAEGRRLAQILLERLARFFSKSSLGC
jgi:hypothetical protein